MDIHTIETQILATKFCAEPCPMRQAYTESEITRHLTTEAVQELAEYRLAAALFGSYS